MSIETLDHMTGDSVHEWDVYVEYNTFRVSRLSTVRQPIREPLSCK